MEALLDGHHIYINTSSAFLGYKASLPIYTAVIISLRNESNERAVELPVTISLFVSLQVANAYVIFLTVYKDWKATFRPH